MSMNSSNGTIPEREVGWHASPQSRGTADILWNCVSVIILITCTSFHPGVGISWKQRIPTTIMAALLPQLTALAAARDMLLANKLTYTFRRWTDGPEWRDGWTSKKSFLVVKRGIGIIQHSGYYSRGSVEAAHTAPDETINRRHSRDSSSEQSMDITSGEITHTEIDGHSSSDSNSYLAMNIPPHKIIDAETFILLAMARIIQYDDFPTTEQINDKSKADWFSKCVTLAQLSWFCLNMLCRGFDSACTISVMEILFLDWILFGFTAVGCWLGCPQNVNTPYIVPIQDYPTSAEAGPISRNTKRVIMGVLVDRLPTYRSHWTDTEICDDPKPIRLKREAAFCGIILLVMVHSVYSFLCSISYPWHSVQPKFFWIIFLSFTVAPEIVLMSADPGICFDWGTTSIYQTCVRSFLPGPPPVRVEDRPGNEWLTLARELGIYRETRGWEETRLKTRYKVVVMAAFVILVCHFGKLVIALTAFNCAPKSTYNVPGYWFLDFFGHVGG